MLEQVLGAIEVTEEQIEKARQTSEDVQLASGPNQFVMIAFDNE